MAAIFISLTIQPVLRKDMTAATIIATITASCATEPTLGTHFEDSREHMFIPTTTHIITIPSDTCVQRLMPGKNMCPTISAMAIYIAGNHNGKEIQ